MQLFPPSQQVLELLDGNILLVSASTDMFNYRPNVTSDLNSTLQPPESDHGRKGRYFDSSQILGWRPDCGNCDATLATVLIE